ncbi:MAG: hypothetical protein LBU60_06180 [Clostridiales bacterium]|jgi:flagellar biosynthesis GTPase FlhF|nr:hypothetical protein [Clostridiales bacterium]
MQSDTKQNETTIAEQANQQLVEVEKDFTELQYEKLLQLDGDASCDKNFKVDQQAYNYMITIPNPKMTEQELYDYLKGLVNVNYFVFSLEKGDEKGLLHHQLYIKFSTMKSYFNAHSPIGINANIRKRHKNSTAEACINYIKKLGKHASKAHTRQSEVFEWGEPKQESTKQNLALVEMVDMVKSGTSAEEIFLKYPKEYARYEKFLDSMTLKIKTDPFKKEYRKVEVIYIYGKTGVGKTSYVYEKHGYQNVYATTISMVSGLMSIWENLFCC